MSKNIDFSESIRNYLHVYFHFLDGYLNPDEGFMQIKIVKPPEDISTLR